MSTGSPVKNKMSP